VSNILYNATPGATEFGYWVRETLRKALFGKVVRAFVLRRRSANAPHRSRCIWELTEVECAIKVSSWSKIQSNYDKGSTLEDPLKEIGAMQYIRKCGRVESHVLTPVEVLADSKYIFVVLPFCKDGELFDRLDNANECFDENESRHWFKQICQGVHSLHQAGVCHRDISLENVLIHGDSCHVIDMGMSLRVPQHEQPDVLLTPQGRCGKYFYMSPEIYANREAFDPYAIDVWSTGAVLFMMLTGAPPYQKPTPSDESFQWIMAGKIPELLEAWDRKLSPEALDLLQGMLRINPTERYTLEEVMNHPWMKIRN